jgi:hypothetical protein
LLTVLDPAAISTRPGYGNAETVATLVRNAKRSIAVTVNVRGDEGGRISAALSGFLDDRGFRTNSGGGNSYTLSAVFTTNDINSDNPRYKFVSYTFPYELINTAGQKVLSGSFSDSEGHLTFAQARDRAIRAAETAIGAEGFAAKFDAYLASLL